MSEMNWRSQEGAVGKVLQMQIEFAADATTSNDEISTESEDMSKTKPAAKLPDTPNPETSERSDIAREQAVEPELVVQAEPVGPVEPPEADSTTEAPPPEEVAEPPRNLSTTPLSDSDAEIE